MRCEGSVAGEGKLVKASLLLSKVLFWDIVIPLRLNVYWFSGIMEVV